MLALLQRDQRRIREFLDLRFGMFHMIYIN